LKALSPAAAADDGGAAPLVCPPLTARLSA